MLDARERHALLSWFDAHKRDLPWRRTQDPYAIWLSEVMLQQTRVETVIPYFERFLEAFPTVQSLAEAPLDSVLAAWAGLGYYRRARMLHAAALQIAALETFPHTADALRKVYGIGPYTAGAVASIAFGEATALVDGNVQRVLSRVCNLDGDMRGTVGSKQAWAEATRLVDSARPGDWNQALMELGARVCTPTSPSCMACPVRGGCKAFAEDLVAERPVMSPKKKATAESLTAYARVEGEAVWLGRRQDHLRFGGLWEPPVGVVECSGPWQVAGQLRHVLTHRILNVTVMLGRVEQGACWGRQSTDYDELRRVPLAELSRGALGLSTLAKKVLAVAGIDARVTRQRTPRLNATNARD